MTLHPRALSLPGRTLWFIVLTIGLSGLGVRSASAQGGPLPARVLGQLGGAVPSALTDGNILWVAAGSRVVAIDWSVDAAPRQLGASPVLDDLVSDLARLDRLLVAGAGRELVVLDGQDPAAIAVRSVTPLPGPASLVRVWDGRAYVVAELGGDPARAELRLYDLADPSAPRLLGGGPVNGAVIDAELVGGVLFLDAGGYLHGIDVRDPGAIRWVTQASRCCVRQLERSGDWLVTIRSDYQRGVEMTERIDVSDPFNPAPPVGSGTNRIEGRQLQILDGRVFEGFAMNYGDDGWLSVLSDPSGPMDWLGRAVLPAPPTAMAVTARRIWVQVGACGWHSLAHDPPALDPSAHAVVDLPFAGSSWGWPAEVDTAAAVGDTAYLLSGRRNRCARLDVVDLTRPEAPRLRATLPLGQVMGRVVTGPPHTVFLTGGDYYETGGLLRALDVRDPSAPLPGDLVHFGDEVLGLGYDGATGRLYASVPVNRPMLASSRSAARIAGPRGDEEPENTGRLYAFDVPEPGRLVAVGSLALGPEPGGLVARDGLVYLAERHHASIDGVADCLLRIVDFRDPHAPGVLSSLPLGISDQQLPALALVGSRLFVAGPQRLWVDVADPRNPRIVARSVAPPLPEGVSVQPSLDSAGGVVALAESELSLFAAASAEPFARLRAPGTSAAVSLRGRQAVLAQWNGGLAVVDLLPPGWRAAAVRYLPALAIGRR